MKRNSLFCLTVIAVILLSDGVICAGTMSELNVKDFGMDSKSSQADVVKNPFAPARPSPRELSLEDLFLNGVIVGEEKSFALINGNILTEGDSIAGLKVKSITKDTVILQHLDRVHTLRIEGGM